jgi:glutaredoxin 3
MAKRILNNNGIQYQEFNVTHDSVLENLMHKRTEQTSVPQIFLNQEHIGGFEKLVQAIRKDNFMENFK